MRMNRREFIVEVAAVSTFAGCANRMPSCGMDGNLSVFISDLHVGGANEKLSYTQGCLARVVDDILAMRPRPRRVVCLGDIAMSYGLPVDYAVSKPILHRLVDAGIELHLTMGNHDRRSAFFEAWPTYANGGAVKGRCSRVVDLGTYDLVLLDTLKGTDDRPLDDMGPVEGSIDPDQLLWFEDFVKTAKRPFLVGSHQFRDLFLERMSPLGLISKSRLAIGWVYGHEHSWTPDIAIGSWADHVIYPTLALPSTGLWGDIGYAVFRADPGGVTAELVQSDFYFQTPTAHVPRPAFWDCRLRENQGKSMRFPFPSL